MNYAKLLEKYRVTVKELLAAGAHPNEAENLACHLVAKQLGNNSENPEDAALYRQLKSEGVPYAYFYGSFVIEKLTIVNNPNIGLEMSVRIPIGHRPAKFDFKRYQALRILSFLKLKFQNFEKDVREGFLYEELSAADQKTIQETKLPLDSSLSTNEREIHRAIRDHFSEKLNQNQVIEQMSPDGAHSLFRLGFSPSRVIFQSKKVFDQFETLTEKSFTKFSERYGTHLPF